ncbi:MAG TPA: hypothetical protein VF516_03125 [Kofleriaceae bacterium]
MRREEISALAIDAFEKGERVRMLGMTNTPTDYEDRKKAAVEMAIAEAEAADAKRTLDAAIKGD